jgi:hypothetical protein
MASITLIHSQETRQVAGVQLIMKCTAFQQNLRLVATPYSIQSSVPLTIFHDFISALEDRVLTITNDNYSGLTLLANEFGFENLTEQLSIFQQSSEFINPISTPDTDVRDRIAAMEELIVHQDRRMAMLQHKLSIQTEQMKRLLTEWLPRLCHLEVMVAEVSAEVKTFHGSSQTAQKLTSDIEQLQRELGVLRSRQSIRETPPVPIIEPVPQLDSRILIEFPPIFGEFRWHEFNLLWRGSRDGFGAGTFHSRCDGHQNTLTVILDTKGNIFGGYTPLSWESREKIGSGWNRYKADDTLRSWLFSLKNPHNVSPMKFALKSSGQRHTIYCGCSGGPEFGAGCDGFGDLAIRDHCNTSNTSSTSLGRSYINNTNVEGHRLLTGSSHFMVKEIEVFEITS